MGLVEKITLGAVFAGMAVTGVSGVSYLGDLMFNGDSANSHGYVYGSSATLGCIAGVGGTVALSLYYAMQNKNNKRVRK